ncbi:MAG TPA: hypothetical protein VF593_04900 [Chthoniobacteraceae bacterium]|jgi:type II secretory pathway pseudopilin PulG
MNHPKQPGFALISTLAVLVVVSILVVAYTSTVRTERSASQNFSERERADAIGQAMVSRLLADHAAPEVPGSSTTGDNRLKPFAVDEGTGTNPGTLLPTAATANTYYAENPLPGIYSMRRQTNLSGANGLVRISQPEIGAGSDDPNRAFTPYEWAYSRVKVTPNSDAKLQEAFLPHDVDKKLIAPQWMDYYGPEDSGSAERVPVGEVAFAIWDESGKLDINMAGRDGTVNGMAPHDLGFEKLAVEGKSKELMALLDGADQARQRTNFSLRAITKDPKNRTGDDRWLFSVDELVFRNVFRPESYNQLNTFSRDFDVRPEWNGDRSPKVAAQFLRSYINNPELFKLFSSDTSSARLVIPTLDNKQLNARLQSELGQQYKNNENYLQMLRLLASLRLSLPPFTPLAGPDPGNTNQTAPLDAYRWTDDDVFGIGLNIMQATAPASDINLFAYDRRPQPQGWGVRPFEDKNNRMGVRVGPYITETALKVQRINADQLRLTQYFEIWNPYGVKLIKPKLKPSDPEQPITYFYGNWTGSGWSGIANTDRGIYGMSGDPELDPQGTNGIARKETFGPGPGQFMVVQLKERIVNVPLANTTSLTVRTRPYLQNRDYWGALKTGTGDGIEESSSFAVSIGPFYTSTTVHQMAHVFKPDRINRPDPAAPGQYLPVWHSFQIDDPRMGPFTRYTATPQDSKTAAGYKYSWQAYPERHSLYSIKDEKTPGVKFASPYGDGFNINFGENFPTGWPTGPEGLKRAMATFALPRRPFLNVGELGSVFANRPWRTLGFGKTLAFPGEEAKFLAPTKPQNSPTALLDYLTTVGTTTDSVNLPFKIPQPDVNSGRPPGSFYTANLKAREQDKTWLFESVDKLGVPNGNLRPIRGRINLNSASKETLIALLSAPYRIPRWHGVMTDWTILNPTPVSSDADSDVNVTVDPQIIEKLAEDITSLKKPIRPFRTMADLARLSTLPGLTQLQTTYPDVIVDAIMGRLAQFGTLRQQVFRVDMAARALNRNVEKQRASNPSIRRVVTAEVRFQTRLYFDTFSRRAFVESIEYR